MKDYIIWCPHCEWFWVGDEPYCVECLQPLDLEDETDLLDIEEE